MAEQPTTYIKMDEWTPLVKGMLQKRFGEVGEAILSPLLEEAGAVISGGSVLNAIVKYMENDTSLDTDIYCPIKNVRMFINSLIKGDNVFDPVFTPNLYSRTSASLYCASFLRRNGIRTIYTFKETGVPVRSLNGDFMAERYARHNENADESDMNINNMDGGAKSGGALRNSVDVMFVRNKRKPTDVVSNFDLTFCQVWYDGLNVYATHPDHIRSKRGILQGDYVKAFLQGNKFLISRLEKYRNRGFTIEMDPDAKRSIDIQDILVGHPIAGYYACRRDRPLESIMEHWFKRIAMYWLNSLHATIITDEKGNDRRVLWFPLMEDNKDNQINILNNYYMEITMDRMGEIDFKLKEEDGYDSEDYDMLATAQSKYKSVTGEKELALSLTPELKLKRMLTALYFNSRYVMTQVHQPGRYVYKFAEWLDFLKAKCLQEGDDMYGGEGQLMHIHNHPEDGAITQESLEAYLEGHMRDTDKNSVPCYYQPEPVGRGGEASTKNCQQKLTLGMVALMTSPEFFERYSAPAPVKAGLNQIVPAYNAMLYNTKTPDPLGFGDIYHATMCPFCLQFENRDEGCLYMGHENPKKLSPIEHPFCLREFLVPSLREKYIKAGRRSQTLVEDHLEFCVECGRPCWGHQHFTLGEEPTVMTVAEKPNERLPGRMVADYGACQGGGRAEMYARVLAVREVYADPRYKTAKEEREAAAWKADAAAGDPVYLERGRKIFETEVNSRKWNNEVPSTKEYIDPAYQQQDVPEGKEEDDMSNMDGGSNRRRRRGLTQRQQRKRSKNRTQRVHIE